MTRVDGVHGPEKKPTVAFIDDWSVLKKALYTLNESALANPGTNSPVITVSREAIGTVLHHVPALMDAYSEAWELMNQMMQAWEQLQESKDSIYVPDAQELVAGLANPERTRR